MTSAAAYIVEVSPTHADRTNVTGTATLAGTVQAVFAPGTYIPGSYTILSATGGRIGTFGSLTTSGLPPGFTAGLSYTATDTILNLFAHLAVLPNYIGTGGLSINQRNVASALDNFFNNGGALPPGFLANLRSRRAATSAMLLSQLRARPRPVRRGRLPDGEPVPRPHARSVRRRAERGRRRRWSGTRLCARARSHARRVRARLCIGVQGSGGAGASLRAAMDDVGRRLWRRQPHLRRSGGDRQPRLSASTAGFAGGFDYRVTPNTVVGLALAGGGTNWSLPRGLAAARATPFRPASTARPARARPISRPPSPSPTTGCRPTASPSPATS